MMLIDNGADVPPPSGGDSTVMSKVVAVVARAAAGSTAVSSVSLTRVDGIATPLARTVVERTKPEPVMVSVASLSHAVTVDGATSTNVGTGFSLPTTGPSLIRERVTGVAPRLSVIGRP